MLWVGLLWATDAISECHEAKLHLVGGRAALRINPGVVACCLCSFDADGKRRGEGALRLASGAVYVGSWLDSKKHGFGMMCYPDGGTYKGGW